MENNILTAKEWLEKEELYFCTKEYRNKVELAAEEVDLFIYMEKYANYKNRILEDRIKEFGRLLKEELTVDDSGSIDIFYIFDKSDLWHYHSIEEVFDKHFNIQKEGV